MPAARTGLCELSAWSTGGPAGNLAFSSFVPQAPQSARTTAPRGRSARARREKESADGLLGSSIMALLRERALRKGSGGCEELALEGFGGSPAGKEKGPVAQRPPETPGLVHQGPERGSAFDRSGARGDANSESGSSDTGGHFPQQADKWGLLPSKSAAKPGFEASPAANNQDPDEKQSARRTSQARSSAEKGSQPASRDLWKKLGKNRAPQRAAPIPAQWSTDELGISSSDHLQVDELLDGFDGFPSRAPLLPEGKDLDSCELSVHTELDAAGLSSMSTGTLMPPSLQEGLDLDSMPPGQGSLFSASKQESLRPTSRLKAQLKKKVQDEASLLSKDRFDVKFNIPDAETGTRLQFARSATLSSASPPVVKDHRGQSPPAASIAVALVGTRRSLVAAHAPLSGPSTSLSISPGKAKPTAAKIQKEEERPRPLTMKEPRPHSAGQAVPSKMLRFSSQRRGARFAAQNLIDGDSGTMWETDGKGEHWLILDLGVHKELCCVQFRCSGTQCDPQSVTLLRGSPGVDDLIRRDEEEVAKTPQTSKRQNGVSGVSTAVLLDNSWIVTRRKTLNSGPQGRDQPVHKLVFPYARGRLWRLVFHTSWSSNGNIKLLPFIKLHGRQPEEKSDSMLARHPSLTTMFTEAVNLGLEEREMRSLARKHGIPINYAEYVRDEFHKYDSGNKGTLDFLDFSRVVRVMTIKKSQTSRAQVNAVLPESRIRFLWHDVDTDGSGEVELEEFLVWFYTNFHPGSREIKGSVHSAQFADSATEHFYAAMGRNRLRNALTNPDPLQPAEREEGHADVVPSERIRPLETGDKSEQNAGTAKSFLSARLWDNVKDKVKMVH
ncbi:unnamed protein product [Polarella glacialis]|nr:unnamed protein product [Polarella glacialis]|mmetsp:Transcript_65896/g.118779  ORF Transcript_65896/g.118779 Transcript_65896/m.118779 type:complete len:839 (-) Transcript_65896:176-2692(-)